MPKKPSLRNHLISFLVGFVSAYLLLNVSSLNCPVTVTKAAEKECDCNESSASPKSAGSPTPEQEKSFYDIGIKHGTDKVQGNTRLVECLKTEGSCIRPGCIRKECRPW
jgi:hypothetical protein